MTLTLVMGDKDVIGRFASWGVQELLQAMMNDFPSFPGRKVLVTKISKVMPDSDIEALLLQSSSEKGEEWQY